MYELIISGSFDIFNFKRLKSAEVRCVQVLGMHRLSCGT